MLNTDGRVIWRGGRRSRFTLVELLEVEKMPWGD